MTENSWIKTGEAHVLLLNPIHFVGFGFKKIRILSFKNLYRCCVMVWDLLSLKARGVHFPPELRLACSLLARLYWFLFVGFSNLKRKISLIKLFSGTFTVFFWHMNLRADRREWTIFSHVTSSVYYACALLMVYFLSFF